MEVVVLVAEGCSNREIGKRLGIAESTAGEYVKRAMQTLKARNRTHLVAFAYQTGHLVVDALDTEAAP
jgi:DNA-binding NarL/FixJ family response regulator